MVKRREESFENEINPLHVLTVEVESLMEDKHQFEQSLCHEDWSLIRSSNPGWVGVAVILLLYWD